MSSPNTSGSQIDNCADPKTISLSQPMTSLPHLKRERQTGALRPGPKNRTSAGPPQLGASPTRNFGCTHAPGWRMKSQGNGLRNTARGFGKRFAARQDSGHSSTGCNDAAVNFCHQPRALQRARAPHSTPAAKRSPTSKLSKHPHRYQRPDTADLRFDDACPAVPA